MVDQSGDRLRVLLARAALSPEQLGHRLNGFAARLNMPERMHPKTPHKWLRGSHPREPWPGLAAALLGQRIGQPIQVEDIGWQSKSAGLSYVSADCGLVLPWTGQGTILATSEVAETSMIDRRVFLTISGAALTQPALEWLIARPAGDVARTVGKRVLDADVDAIESVTAQLRTMDDRFGGTALKVVKAQIQFVLDLLRDRQYTESVGIRLHGAVAELHRLAGYMSFDMGDHPQAQRFYLSALHAAHTAGDRALGANILGFMSHQAEDLGMPGEAVRLIEAARHGYPGSSSRVAAILDTRAARAYGKERNARQCRDAIESAYTHLRDALPDGGQPAWSYWLDEAHLNLQAGRSYLHLGDWPNAQHHLAVAVRLNDDAAFPRQGAQARANLALAHARQRQPDRAVDIATRAVDMLANDVTSARTASRIKQVADALRPYHKMPPIREFEERVDQLLPATA